MNEGDLDVQLMSFLARSSHLNGFTNVSVFSFYGYLTKQSRQDKALVIVGDTIFIYW